MRARDTQDRLSVAEGSSVTAKTPEPRPFWGRWYDSARWRQLRALQLAAKPTCKMCAAEGFIEPATHVDHVQPHRGDLTLFWDPTNLQSLCATHHSATKQRIEKAKPKAEPQAIGLDGWPVD